MKIGFDAAPLIHPVGGIANYAKNLLHALLELKSGDTFFGYIPTGTTTRLPWPIESHPDYLQWVEAGPLSFRVRGYIDQLDVYHGTNFKVQTSGRYGTVLTIHDLWLDRHPEYSKKLFGQRLSFIRTKRRVQRASHVIAVSDFTANEIQELYEVPAKKISVIHHGLPKDFFPDPGADTDYLALRERLGISGKPFILFVGGANPRKNHQTLLKAFAENAFLRQSYSLIMVGSTTFKRLTIGKTIHDLSVSECVVCIEQLPLNELRVLYSRASLFVFPSRYEGFGFPVLEAMACGVPVVTSRCSALPEVAGEAAVLVDPEDAKALEQAMVQVLQDSDFQATLRQRGLKQAASFDWTRMAEETLQVYQSICQ
ncbi:MAG: glycosyltransferase family 1 protein [Nitrospirae bacterium]|nr:glycosyltransferase family 1 protein [Nitrospirota bacterium]MDA1305305.1 glycosyltransferase family 1 protein [Nitrospirota bacterium]